MANFKGFKQETLTNYNALTKEEKLNYLWLVRDVDKSGETEVVKSSAIYFGSRKYAEVNAIENRVGVVEGKVKDLESKSTITVADYSKITGLTGCSVGQFVYANNNYTDPNNSGSTFAAGAYLITSVDTTGKPLTIAKIESTSQTEAAPVERIAALEGQVNGITAQIGEKGKDGKEGTGILGDIQKLQSSHDVTGDDVE